MSSLLTYAGIGVGMLVSVMFVMALMGMEVPGVLPDFSAAPSP